MNDILHAITENKRRELKALFPAEDKILQEITNLSLPPVFSMSKSLKKTPGGIIAEFKRRSPSKGEIAPMADVERVIRQYHDHGAAACSVLTDTRFFGGAPSDLALARVHSGKTPLLRKDFIISKVQIAEARKLGASAVLLIAAMLSKEELFDFNEYAHFLNMEALVEIHDLKELNKIEFMPDMLGVNNRNLSSFNTDLNNSLDLIKYLPKDCVLVAESGIKSPEEVKHLKEAGFTGFLIGESFMSASNPGAILKNFINEIG